MHLRLISTILFGCLLASCSPATQDSASILLVGDTTFYEHSKRASEMLEERGYDFPLLNFKDILTEADFVIANLEALPIGERKSKLEGIKSYILWQSRDESLEALKRHNIHTVNLANNHAMDFEVEGIIEAQKNLDSHGFTYFGAGATEDSSGRVFKKDIKVGNQKFKFALVVGLERYWDYDEYFGYYADGEKGGVLALGDKTVEAIRKLKEEEPDRFVIVSPHWGYNYSWRTKTQEEFADSFLKAGADIIIAHGAHHLQGIEMQDEKWIVYDIGNFSFNSWSLYQKNEAPPYSLIASLIITPENKGDPSIALRLYPILTDNRLVDYAVDFVSENRFKEAHSILKSRSKDLDTFNKNVITGKDEHGYFFELPVRQ
ncbi:MAG: CapA family protein [Kiritimatiellales bacterium]|nr:CapA family protein [Kiritimatiellales bacterium]